MFRAVANGAEALFQNPDCRLVYIASNHASHAQYAIAALQNGRDVFIEKPVCTKWSDLEALEACITQSSRRVCAGFNRPFSAAIRELRAAVSGLRSPLTMACFIHGHRIPADHWYRAPDEGTRISGNAGHWLDLAVHLLTAVWGAPPSSIHLNHTPALVAEPDDNFSLTLHTDNGDLITIILSSRNEPTEGVRETIEIQCGDVSAQIDDFRAMRMWRGGASIQRRYQPKDVGHRLCTLQPFLPAAQQRDWTEVVYSTRLMLHATDLARRGGGTATADLARTAAPASFDPE